MTVTSAVLGVSYLTRTGANDDPTTQKTDSHVDFLNLIVDMNIDDWINQWQSLAVIFVMENNEKRRLRSVDLLYPQMCCFTRVSHTGQCICIVLAHRVDIVPSCWMLSIIGPVSLSVCVTMCDSV